MCGAESLFTKEGLAAGGGARQRRGAQKTAADRLTDASAAERAREQRLMAGEMERERLTTERERRLRAAAAGSSILGGVGGGFAPGSPKGGKSLLGS